jgi:peptide/nickel transport system substrate-binding protein
MRYRNWRFISILLALAFLLPALAACQPKVEATETAPIGEEEEAVVEEVVEEEAVPAEPVTMRLGTTFIWNGNNLGVEVGGWLAYRLIFDSIVEFGARGITMPGLAESWTVDDTGLVWTFKIREGITFHDGTPCTAEEIAWSLTWMEEVGFDSIAYMWSGMFEEVVALDATTLQITTFSPISYMEYVLSYSFVVPESVWGEITDHETMAAYTGEDATIGTGPFIVKEWVPEEYLIFQPLLN